MATCDLICSIGMDEAKFREKFGEGSRKELLQKFRSYALREFRKDCKDYRENRRKKLPGHNADMVVTTLTKLEIPAYRKSYRAWCPYSVPLDKDD